ncbi:hypothetical protein GCM10022276_21900 [Sphingomonas limnosediminicola]|jgi:hypothetical protein|uniref:Uncharacterized protein n=1 Tax=Sphingomonas limnosediminicola TaxID=940133 RepID=A0ABP7LL41_9SPHN
MKSNHTCRDISGPLLRRDLLAMFAYVNRNGRSSKCVDGTFGDAEVHLERLAAAAGMQ